MDTSTELLTINHDITALNEHKNHTLIAHLNAQCLSTSIDKFNVKLNTYGFDIVSISETWLKGNKDVINYLQISDMNSSITTKNILEVGLQPIISKNNLN